MSRAFATNFSSELGGGPPIEGGSAAGSYLVGRFAIESGDYAAAAESLDRALAADPENLDLRRQVFLLRLANGDDERALAAAASLVEIDAGADEPLLLLALDRVRAGKHAQARDLLERVSERVPRASSCRCSTPGPRSCRRRQGALAKIGGESSGAAALSAPPLPSRPDAGAEPAAGRRCLAA